MFLGVICVLLPPRSDSPAQPISSERSSQCVIPSQRNIASRQRPSPRHCSWSGPHRLTGETHRQSHTAEYHVHRDAAAGLDRTAPSDGRDAPSVTHGGISRPPRRCSWPGPHRLTGETHRQSHTAEYHVHRDAAAGLDRTAPSDGRDAPSVTHGGIPRPPRHCSWPGPHRRTGETHRQSHTAEYHVHRDAAAGLDRTAPSDGRDAPSVTHGGIPRPPRHCSWPGPHRLTGETHRQSHTAEYHVHRDTAAGRDRTV